MMKQTRDKAKPHRLKRTLFITALLLLSAGNLRETLAAQEPKAAPTKTAAGVIFAPDEDYRIGPSDIIEIQVEDAPQLSGNRRVSASGNIQMPYLRKVHVLNRTTEEAAAIIADGLRGRYLKDPQVFVSVLQPNSRMFMIQGAVRNPGTYFIEGRPTLVQLISAAGGLAENYGSTAYILRPAKAEDKDRVDTSDKGAGATATAGDGSTASPSSQASAVAPTPDEAQAAGAEYEIVPVNISRFLKGVVGNASLYIKPGDVVNVPQTDVFFVAGEVRQPGEFPLKEGTTLRQALSLAQGTNFEAAQSRAVIFREAADGKREEIPVDIGAVMSNKKPDVMILPNDVIVVPNSRTKSVAGALLRAFGASSVRLPVR